MRPLRALLPVFGLLIGLLLMLKLLSIPQNTFFVPLPQSKSYNEQNVHEIVERLHAFEQLNAKHHAEILRLHLQLGHLMQMRQQNVSNGTQSMQSDHLALPSIAHSLDQLTFYQGSLDPVFTIRSKTNIREMAELVFGLPTVQRPTKSYLLDTLENLIENLTPNELHKCLFIVFIAENEIENVHKVANELQTRFQQHIDSGLIEIIAPPSILYEGLDTLRDQPDPMGDSSSHVRWRTKQNLDYAYLMMYAASRGLYYVQLEDDILTKRGFANKILAFATRQSARTRTWLVLEFANLGFIGRLLRCSDLPDLAAFLLLFHRDKPVDWLLVNFAQVRYCRNDHSPSRCRVRLQRHLVQYRPPLFQHVGLHSSMLGKIQKLKERNFAPGNEFHHHTDNPDCEVHTTLAHHKHYSLASAYAGWTVFWALNPQAEGQIRFDFKHQPVQVEKYIFRTGNTEHPHDLLVHANVSVLPVLRPDEKINASYTRNRHGYYVVDSFEGKHGLVTGDLVPFGALHSIMIEILKNHENWVLFTEIYIKPKLT